MFELRWLEYKKETHRSPDLGNGKCVVSSALVKKLQYRYKVKNPTYDDNWVKTEYLWSEWKDVPVEGEE